MKISVLMVMVVLAVLVLTTENIYAAPGDLIVYGNFGVGTGTAPTPRAEINGNLKVNGTVTSNGETVTGNSTVNGKLSVGTNSSQTNLAVVGNANISGTISGATYGFGGMYFTGYGCDGDTTNPYKGDTAACPDGFNEKVVRIYWGGSDCNLHWCYKP